MDSRLRGNDEAVGCRRMDSRLRGNDDVVGCRFLIFVIPVQTGLQVFLSMKQRFRPKNLPEQLLFLMWQGRNPHPALSLGERGKAPDAGVERAPAQAGLASIANLRIAKYPRLTKVLAAQALF